MLANAELYMWRSDLASAAQEASEQLTGLVTLNLDLMPSRSGLYVFETEIPFTGCKYGLSGIGWEPFGEDMTAVFIYNSSAHGGVMLAFSGFCLKNNRDCAIEATQMTRCSIDDIKPTPANDNAFFDVRRLGTDREFDPIIGTPSIVRFLVSSWLWLKQRIMRPHAEIANSRARKQAEHISMRASVNVILLRRSEHDGAQTPAHSPEWSCQWLVRGHWRQQYLPSTQSHRPTWIEPYVKGPDDKPLKAPTPTVYQVIR